MNTNINILVVEDDCASADVLCFNLEKKGYKVKTFENAEEALLYFSQNPVDLALLDFSLPGMTGEELFMQMKKHNPLTPVIFMTAMQSVDKAVELLKKGAYTYLTKPLNLQTLLNNVKKALDESKIQQETKEARRQIAETTPASPGKYVFKAPRMQEILRLITRVAGANSNVLITGESGTGKDVAAHMIHLSSQRKENNLVKVNLAALPSTLIEAELFGAQKGAYSGAVENRAGKFEEAHNGTLFLDEIGELTMDIQVKLLRVIQDREITRLGSNQSKKVDIRLITATNQNLPELIKEKKFREDLFYRLNVIEIQLPPLRERKEDIPHLINSFIDNFNQTVGKNISGISKEALDALLKYNYPGNIRELENIIERAMVLAANNILDTDDLPIYILNTSEDGMDIMTENDSLTLPEKMNAIEKHILEKYLKKYNFHQSKTADQLGISEACLRYKIRSLGIRKQK